MTRKKKMVIVLVVFAVLLGIAGCKFSRFGYESAGYAVKEAEGKFELREYAAFARVEAVMEGDEQDGAFMKLFRYIGGKNAGEEKIAMTTPVLITEEEDGRAMSFVMPAEVAAGEVPEPGEGMRVIREGGGTYAVYRFAGKFREGRFEEEAEMLREWVRGKGWRVEGEVISAGFDPPMMPGFLRRNEVMVKVVTD